LFSENSQDVLEIRLQYHQLISIMWSIIKLKPGILMEISLDFGLDDQVSKNWASPP
jgi:hypothetical protein